MKKTIILLSCLALFILNSCDNNKDDSSVMVKSETATVDMSGVKAEIQSIENEWADALTKRDVNALMALYTDDAISMQDGAPTLNGKAAIRAQEEKDMANPPTYASISFKTQAVYGTPEEVTEVGTSSEKDAAGKETATGKYMVVFRKVDGRYKCVAEIYNKDTK
jgi:ketosteroid isomerase-like protein